LKDIPPKPIEWLWRGRIAVGKLSLLAGVPGQGKSFLTLDLASRVTTGQKWPDGNGEAPQGSVVILSCEDDTSDTIRPRVDAAGGDVNQIFLLQGKKHGETRADSQNGSNVRDIDLENDLDVIRKAVGAAKNCRLLIVDPISAYMGKTDSYKDSDVRRVLRPLGEMAAELHIAVIAIMHFKKGEESAINKVAGSIAFTAAARSVWTLIEDRNDPHHQRRLFLPIKNNLCKKKQIRACAAIIRTA